MSKEKRSDFHPIAIVGIGVLFPQSNHAQALWKNIVDGKDLIRDILPTHWLIEDYYDPNPRAKDKTYSKRGAFLDFIDFDPTEYGIPPNNIPAIDSSQLLALIVAKQVLNDAAVGKSGNQDLSRTSVILGGAALEGLQYASARMQRPVWAKALRECGLDETAINTICEKISDSYVPWQENTFPGLLANVTAGRIANRFNLGGTNCITDAACAGSLAALSMACNELQLGQADMVITGGVDALNDIVMYMCFSKTGALSHSGDCRPFSEQADGTILGEGIGMFALKRLDDAEKQGDQIYAVIKSVGTSSDGRAKSIYAPLAKGQAKAILRAYDTAGFTPDTVGLIEAHGTGTKAGDMAELEGLMTSFTTAKSHKKNYCALGSIKSQIGHTKSAAGAAGLFKAVMALHHKVLPPTIKIDKPNANLNLTDSPFYLNTSLRPWIHNETTPRRAGISAFGFGGSNFHIAVEEYKGPGKKPTRLRTAAAELLVFSAESGKALLGRLSNWLNEFEVHTINLSNLAYHLQKNYESHHLARLAIVATNPEELINKIKLVITELKNATKNTFTLSNGIYYNFGKDSGKVAFMFPGQGSQYLNMGADLLMEFSDLTEFWDKYANISNFPGISLSDIVFPKPTFNKDDAHQQHLQLTATEWAQPALAVTSLIYLKLLNKLGIKADCALGHSFGELMALHCANAVDEPTLFKIALKRGELMAEAGRENAGAMLSVQGDATQIIALLQQHAIAVTPANFNSPKQLVLAGVTSAIAQAEALLSQKNIKSIRLSVATAFHSEIVAAISKPFYKFLNKEKFNQLKMPVWSNLTEDVYPADPDKISDYLSQQLANPVLFQKMINDCYAAGVRTFIEVGPQQVLTKLVKQNLDHADVTVIALDHREDNGLTALWHGLAQMFVNGLNPKFETLWNEYQPGEPLEKIDLKKLNIKINGTNYAKPYPVLDTAANSAQPLTFSTTSKNNFLNSSNLVKDNAMNEKTNLQLLQIYQEMQKQLIDAHYSYQTAMSNSHIAFLNSMTQLSHQFMQGGSMPAMPMFNSVAMPVTNMPMMNPGYAAPNAMPSPAIQPMQQAALQPLFNQSMPPAPLASTNFITNTASIVDPSIIVKPDVTHSTTHPVTNMKSLLLEVVTEKTGYPSEMLNMDMLIEADLGIDSIKRVEILSQLSEKLPYLPEIAPHELAELRSLGDIVSYIERHAHNHHGAAVHA